MSETSLLELTDNPDLSANDYVVAKNMAEKLHEKYPGHLWAVTCDGKTGIATIRNLRLSGQFGYVLHLDRVYADPNLDCVMRAGGEILERFFQRRGVVNGEHIDSLPTFANGFPLFDYMAARSDLPRCVTEAVDRSRRLRG